MASASSSSLLSISSSSALFDGKAPRQPSLAPPQCVSLPSLPPRPLQSRNRPSKSAPHCRKLARDVVAMATGESADAAELPEVFKTVQEAWDKVEDKYAVSSLAVAGVIALWGSTGLIAAIDRLPLIPSVLEIVGIGYTGWFVYQNLVFKPDREALIAKVKSTYSDIIGSS